MNCQCPCQQGRFIHQPGCCPCAGARMRRRGFGDTQANWAGAAAGLATIGVVFGGSLLLFGGGLKAMGYL